MNKIRIYEDKIQHRIRVLILILWFTLSSTIFNVMLFRSLNGLNYHNVQDQSRVNCEEILNLPTPSSISPYDYYKIITIDHTRVNGSVDLTNFPVLLSIIDSDLDDKAQHDGDDIAFANYDGWLDHEIELYNPNYSMDEAQLIAWVRIPLLSTSKDTAIFMFYGNTDIVSQENPSGVWKDYVGVWHFAESLGVAKDSTTYNVNGTTTNIDYQETGQIGQCFNWTDGESSQVNYGDPIDDHLDFGSGNMTVSLWINLDRDVDDSQWIVSKGRTAKPNDPGFIINSDLAPTSLWRFTLGNSPTSYTVESDPIVDFDEWNYIVGTVDRRSDFSYLYTNNGSYDNRIEISGLGSISNSDNLILPWNPTDNGFDGLLDELRLTNKYRTGGWINTEYSNQYYPNYFYSIGIELSGWNHPLNAHYFTNYKEIIIDHTKVSGSEDFQNFPILISTFDEDLHDKVRIDGNDIVFSDGMFWLEHEIEFFEKSYNSTHAQLVAWVRLPRLSTSLDTVIRMYYGNLTMESRENPEAVWGSNYEGVWHLSEDPAGIIYDSTSNNHDCISYGSMNSGDSVLGKIDGALDFDGNDDYIQWESVFSQKTATYSLWLYPHSVTGTHVFLGWNSFVSRLYLNYIGNIRVETIESMEIFIFDEFNIAEHEWYNIVVVRDGDIGNLYINGFWVQQIVITGAANLWVNSIGGTNDEWNMFDGNIDEVRISNYTYSSDWIKTEYNNQYNPQSFLTIGSEKSLDETPPTYSNLMESSNPLELGNIEIVTINVSDPSGVNQVQIEFGGANHSMINIGGDTWQYNSWFPISVDNNTYTIWMEDNYNNWNSTIGIIEVIDTISPTYSDLIESADPLQLGQNETITLKVYDSSGSGVNKVLLEYDSSNHTMVFMGGNTWSWSKWKPTSTGVHSYKIYMNDTENNWNMTSCTITVVSTTAPVLENHTKIDPLELGNNVSIKVDVVDNETTADVVLIELDGVNYTMSNIGGFTYEYKNRTRSYVGIVYYTIFANDTDNNWNSLTSSFDIVDTTPPAFSDLIKSNDTLELGNPVIISVNSTDLSDINQVKIEIEELNHSMTFIGGNMWRYDLWIPSATGNNSYTIWAEDLNGNWGNIGDSILVQDTTLPVYSDLIESAKIIELGDSLTISINCTDLAGIKDVLIEYENSNYSMTNIGGYIWQYNSWMPNSIGNYSYRIYITDNHDNINSVYSSILFQDTIIPVYANIFENANPLELGNNQIIRIDVYDIAGINQTLIEFESANHSMINIYGYTWQYDSWTPSNWITYQYRIHMEDLSGNWNLFVANITVQDTTAPSAPILTNSPSGDVSGILLFDWLDGYDPSGISSYILIIDNETDPFNTPGYIFKVNITNTSQGSSFFELSEELIEGIYYYFLSQIDGSGHQSTYTTGTFNVIKPSNGSNNFLIYVIFGIVIASVAGLIATATIVRKRTKREMFPHRKKIVLKEITAHINKLSTVQISQPKDEFIGLPRDITEILIEEEELEIKVSKIKNLGEQLFTEGAYLEAQKQFELGRNILKNLGKQEEAQLFTDLILGIEGLIAEREERLVSLELLKHEGNSRQIFNTYQDIIELSNKLGDQETSNFYQSDLILFFQKIHLNKIELESYRFELKQKADELINNNIFDKAAEHYEKCEQISALLVQLERKKKVSYIENKNKHLNKLNNN